MRYLTIFSVLSVTFLAVSAMGAEMATGAKCELSKQVRVSAKDKGKGKKTKVKKGTVLEVVNLGKAWSEVKSEETTGFIKTKQLNKVCKVMEEEEAPAPEADEGAAEGAEEGAAEGAAEGAMEGGAEGAAEGAAGAGEGAAEGAAEGMAEGGAEVAAAGDAEAMGEATGATAEGEAAAGAEGEAAAGTGAGDMAAGDAMQPPEGEAELPPAEPREGPEDLLEIGFGILGPIGGIGSDIKGYGVGGMAELRYNITENFAAGIRTEVDVMVSGGVSGADDVSVGLNVTAAFLLEGEAQLFESGISPVGGVGVGFYNVGGLEADVGTDGAGVGAKAGRLFGVAPKLGIDLGGFRIAALYHFIFGKTKVAIDINTKKEVSRNFLVVELSGQIGLL